MRPIVRRRAGIPAAGGACCAKPGGGGLPSPPQLLKAAIAGFSSSAVSALGGSALGGSEGSWPPILVGFDMWTTRQFRSKGKQREEPSYGTYAARRGNPLVGQVSVCQVLARQRGYTPRFYFELYCTAYLRDPCGPRRIDECRERRFIGNARAGGARTGSPEKSAQKSESSRPSVDQRRLRLSCGDLLQLSVPWPTRWINVKQSLVAQVHCTQKQFAAAVHHFGTPLQQRRAVQAFSPRDWLQKEAQSWQHASPCSSRTSPSPPRV